jgi:hypothetical protein
MLQDKFIIKIRLITLFILLVCIGCINKNCGCQKYKSYAVIDTTISRVNLVKINSGWYKSGLKCETKKIDYSYWIGRYEITNKQFFDFMIDAIHENKIVLNQHKILCFYEGNENIKPDSFVVKYTDHAIYLNSNNQIELNEQYANHPVIGVSWFGAKAFCTFYGFDLPSVDEWEKAARGNNCSRFPWGDEIDSTYANYFNSNDPFEPYTTPIGFYNGTKKNNLNTKDAVSAYGCYDMAGNAWEWTRDKFENNSGYYCGKGGGFNLHTPAHMQVYYLSTFRVKDKHPALDRTHLSDGFRVIKHINN